MEKLDKVELVREKTGVSYEEAREALVTNDYDVLDAIIWLEREGKTSKATAHYATNPEAEDATPSPTPTQIAIAQSTGKGKGAGSSTDEGQDRFEEHMGTVYASVKRILRAGIDNTFIAEKEGERVIALPVLIVILGIFLWGASIWLLIIGLFFGLRYRIEGKEPATIDVNDVMDRAADAADTIKRDFTGK